MKHIKEYSNYLPNQFTPEDIEELEDVYLDMVDDLDLNDNSPKAKLVEDLGLAVASQILSLNDSSFQLPRMYKGKMCKISIRTIVTPISVIISKNAEKITKEQMENHHQKLELLQPHLKRIKRMGYRVEVKDLLVGIDELVVNGVEIEITKNF